MSIVSKLLVSGIILVLAGCGGSGNTSNTTSAAPVSPQNTAPTIDSFLTRTISDNGRVTLTWRVTDAQQTNLSCSISISGGISLSQSISNCVTTTQFTFTAPTNTNYQALLKVSDGTSSTSQNLVINVTNLPSTQPCLLYTSPSPRDGLLSRMPSSA